MVMVWYGGRPWLEKNGKFLQFLCKTQKEKILIYHHVVSNVAFKSCKLTDCLMIESDFSFMVLQCGITWIIALSFSNCHIKDQTMVINHRCNDLPQEEATCFGASAWLSNLWAFLSVKESQIHGLQLCDYFFRSVLWWCCPRLCVTTCYSSFHSSGLSHQVDHSSHWVCCQHTVSTTAPLILKTYLICFQHVFFLGNSI